MKVPPSLLYWLLDFTAGSEEVEAFSESITETLERWRKLNPKEILATIAESLVGLGPDLLAALIVFAVGLLIVRGTGGLVKKLLHSSKIDRTLHYFIRTSVKVLLYALIIITCLGILGVPLTPIITAMGAIGLALSLAVQDSLTNLAGGLSILFNRPFAVGDFIEVGDRMGTVRQIRLFYTLISSTDNKHIYLPNGDMAKAVVINYSAEATRRLDLTFSVRGDSDIGEARKIVGDVVQTCQWVLQEPEPVVRVNGQTYVLVHIVCLVWVNAPDYFTANAYLIEHVRKKLSEAGFIPAYTDKLPELER